jgi:hypothetical protein
MVLVPWSVQRQKHIKKSSHWYTNMVIPFYQGSTLRLSAWPGQPNLAVGFPCKLALRTTKYFAFLLIYCTLDKYKSLQATSFNLILAYRYTCPIDKWFKKLMLSPVYLLCVDQSQVRRGLLRTESWLGRAQPRRSTATAVGAVGSGVEEHGCQPPPLATRPMHQPPPVATRPMHQPPGVGAASE